MAIISGSSGGECKRAWGERNAGPAGGRHQILAIGIISSRGGGEGAWGGGELFRSLLELKLVDVVEVAVIPVLLGSGLPMLPTAARSAKLKLKSHKIYEKTGTVLLTYDVKY